MEKIYIIKAFLNKFEHAQFKAHCATKGIAMQDMLRTLIRAELGDEFLEKELLFLEAKEELDG